MKNKRSNSNLAILKGTEKSDKQSLRCFQTGGIILQSEKKQNIVKNLICCLISQKLILGGTDINTIFLFLLDL